MPQSKPACFLRTALPISMLLLAACGSLTAPADLDDDISVPAPSEWVDYGTIFESGILGEWDYQLFGGFTAAAIKKAGIYYLYYQGASGYRIADDSVTWRSIGVATSPDGVNFTKHSENPNITWFPNDNGEEGAVSAGAALDENGEIVLYYGANTEQSHTLINADGRLATSLNGLDFTDQGVALDHRDNSLWGSRDELFPIIAIHDANQWFVYYIPNGSLQSRKLGVAWGDSRDRLTDSAGVLSGLSSIRVWGTGGKARIGPGTYALFLNDLTQSRIEVRTVSLNSPNRLSAPVETYQFDEVQQATVLLDEEANTWFMYYRSADQSAYGIKLAPADEADMTPPTSPENVTAFPISDRQIDLAWDPSTDGETGIVQYQIFRDGLHLASVKGWTFSDTGLIEKTPYSYQVSAVNYHGVEGPRSDAVTGTTLADTTPPRIASVNVGHTANQVTVVFDEPVEKTSAELASNYVISSLDVLSASLASDLKTVSLTTSAHSAGSYKITIRDVRDRAETPNSLDPATELSYLYTGLSGLVAAWPFDEGQGNTALDLSNHANHGQLVYTEKPGPIWTAGRIGGALQFDGVDDQVTIDGIAPLEDLTDNNYTFAAWVNPDSAPPNTTANDGSYSILVRQRTGLFYDHDQRYRALIRLQDGSEIAVSSGVISPGSWRHVAMVVDDVNKRLHLYIDGQEVAGSPTVYSGALADLGEAPYYIGTSDPLTERYEYRFRGKIDEARIFNLALNPSEVLRLYDWLPSAPVSFLTYLPESIHKNRP